jgi:hypothetical protein
VQQEEVLETEDGVLEPELREVRDGTSESSSEESSSESSSESLTLEAANLAASCSTVGPEKVSERRAALAWGFWGIGDLIWDGLRERPLGMSETRRDWRTALSVAAAAVVLYSGATART